MKADVIIVSYNTCSLLREALESLSRYGGEALGDVIVVDNRSTDGTAERIRADFPEATIIEAAENGGFGAGNNIGLAASGAEFVLFLNPDAMLEKDALRRLAGYLEAHPKAGFVGPQLRYPDGRFQPSCRRFPNALRNLWCFSGLEARFGRHVPWLTNWLNEDEHRAGAVDMVSGACFLARRLCIDAMGGFDENLFIYEEEADLMLPARRAGYETHFCPEAVVIHVGGASAEPGGESPFSKRHLFRSKYYVFRKHYGRAHAWLAYLSDLCLFGLSLVFARLRGRVSANAGLFSICRRAWRESYASIQELRVSSRLFS